MDPEEALKDRSVRKFVKEIAGEEGIDIIDAMGNDELTDEDITERVEFELNTTRRALYDLYEARLATYDRSRNEETGWITYTWRLTLDNLEEAVKGQKREILDNLKERLEYEKNNEFYGCPEEHGKWLFEDAMDLGFRCPECGDQLEPVDNSDFIEQMEEKIETLERELASV